MSGAMPKDYGYFGPKYSSADDIKLPGELKVRQESSFQAIFDSIGGVSFLPLSEHSYKQAPYQEITKEEYSTALAAMPKNIPWQSLPLYELEDSTTGSQELACSGPTGCEVVDLVSA